MILVKMFSRKWLLTTLLVVLGAGVCVRLGIWQLDRLAQRRTFNASVNAARAMAPAVLPADSSPELVNMEYRAAQASGTYDFSHQVALRSQYYQNQYGYHLLTPLLLSDGSAVLVDRGWIPSKGNDRPDGWPRYDTAPQTAVSGILRLSRAQPDFGGVPDPTLMPAQPGLDFWNMPNIERIGHQTPYPLLPVYIELNPSPVGTRPPIPVLADVDLTEGPHMGYALQWFAFASILFVGYPFYLRRQVLRETT